MEEPSIYPLRKIQSKEGLVCTSENTYYFIQPDGLFSIPDRRLMAAFPEPATPLFTFMNENPALYIEKCENTYLYVSEYIEGTPVTLFYDDRRRQWEMVTHFAVGGDHYFRDPDDEDDMLSFYDLFLDVFGLRGQSLGDVDLFTNLPKTHCYHFVLQHPAIKKLQRIDRPALYLVGVYDIHPDGHATRIPAVVYETWDVLQTPAVIFPRRILTTGETYVSLQSKYASILTHVMVVGILIENIHTGKRAIMKNPIYEGIRKILEAYPDEYNHTHLFYRFLELHKGGHLTDYLVCCPDDESQFAQFYRGFNDYVDQIESAYVNWYIVKTDELVSPRYKYHIRRLYTDFRDRLTKEDVRAYLLRLPKEELAYFLLPATP